MIPARAAHPERAAHRIEKRVDIAKEIIQPPTMPPIRKKTRQKLAQREGPLLIAVRAIEKGEIRSIREAARIFNVPRSTLRGRVNGQTSRPDTRANNHTLTVQEEASLVKWIFDLDYRGQAPQQCMVREMADLLLADRVSKTSSKRRAQVGKNWVTGFVRRQPELQSRFSRKYNYKRAQNEDPEVIRAWFDKVRQTICRYGITDADIYNFDETGFAMGVTATSKVVTRSEYYGKRAVAEPGNREWVTAIECIGSGFALDPYIIFKGRVFIRGWFEYLPKGWRLDKSENGWTTDEIGLRWLSESFIPQTKGRRQGRWLLLILDGHGSHLTPRFDKLCAENDIIAICMPAHSSHILQPLDVGCFAPLKRSYGRIVDRWMRAGVDFVDKLEFLSNYPEARSDAFTSETIQNSFRAAGLLPYHPTEVLDKVNIRIRTPTPPSSRGSSVLPPQTPINPRQLLRQASSIKSGLKQCSNSPSSPIKTALEQVFKGCEIAMHNAAFLARQNEQLRAANQKQRIKRQASTRQVAYQYSLDASEAAGLVAELSEASASTPQGAADRRKTSAQASIRAPKRCSGCRGLDHTYRRCPERA